MPDGVFDERLQDEAWYERVAGFSGDLDPDPEPVSKADLLQGQIPVGERELVAQPNGLLAVRIERQPEQITELLDHGSRQPGIASTCDETALSVLNRSEDQAAS